MTSDRRSSFDAAYFERPSVVKSSRAAATYAAMMSQQLGTASLVVDVGCASGGVGAELRRVTGWDVIGLDLSAVPLVARRSDLTVVCASTYQLPLPAGTADGAFFLDVVEHLENPLAALVELRRVVRDGGSLVVSTPNAGSPLRSVLGQRWHGLADKTHLYFFDAFSLGHLLEKAGWRPLRSITTSGAPGLAGRVLSRTRVGGELCILAAAR